MKQSAEKECAEARALTRRLQSLACARDDEPEQQDTSTSEDLIEMDDVGIVMATTIHSGLGDPDIEWLLEAAQAGSWIAAEDLKDKDSSLFATNVGTIHRSMGLRSMRPLKASSLCHAVVLRGDELSLDRLLDDRPCTVNDTNCHGETAISVALRTGQPRLARMLLKSGASLDVSDRNGVRPLHWIITLDSTGLEIVGRHLSVADPNVQSDNPVTCSTYFASRLEPGTPLDWAIDVRNLAAVKFLLDRKASALVEMKGRTSALHRAFGRHDRIVCKMILDTHLKTHLKTHSGVLLDAQGESPLGYALGNNGFSLDRLLYQILPENSLSEQLDLFCTIPSADVRYINHLG